MDLQSRHSANDRGNFQSCYAGVRQMAALAVTAGSSSSGDVLRLPGIHSIPLNPTRGHQVPHSAPWGCRSPSGAEKDFLLRPGGFGNRVVCTPPGMISFSAPVRRALHWRKSFSAPLRGGLARSNARGIVTPTAREAKLVAFTTSSSCGRGGGEQYTQYP